LHACCCKVAVMRASAPTLCGTLCGKQPAALNKHSVASRLRMQPTTDLCLCTRAAPTEPMDVMKAGSEYTSFYIWVDVKLHIAA
jgi:hypothetical protein